MTSAFEQWWKILLLLDYENIDYENRYNKPWILANYGDTSATPPAQEDDEIIEYGDDSELDFDTSSIVRETKYEATRHGPYCIVFLGFDPYKEVAFFCSNSSVLAYQLNTPKTQELGLLDSLFYINTPSFLYTPCWMQIEHLYFGQNKIQ